MDHDHGPILQAAITRHGSLYRVAKLCGVAYHTAHRWKTGASSPRGGNLLKLIDLAGKSVKLLAGLALLLASALPFEKDATAGTGEVRPEFNRSIHYTQYHIFEL